LVVPFLGRAGPLPPVPGGFSADDCEDFPGAGHSLELVGARVSSRIGDARDQVANGAGDQVQVRYAAGDEDYLTFSGQAEHPAPHEVIFADRARRVHARRWTNRQSGLSAVQAPTAAALIVAEAMHDSASKDVPELIAAVARELATVWSITPVTAVLSQSTPRFTFEP